MGAVPGDKDNGTFTPRILAVNATGWGTLKKFLRRTDAHVVCAQELQLRATACAEASQWAWRFGWKSLFSPSILCTTGGLSAGVTIFAREEYGLPEPKPGVTASTEIVPARIVVGAVELPG